MAPVQFNVGDVVQLKSGGPKMTVTNFGDEDDVRTTWFAGSKKETGTFPVNTLVPVQDEQHK